MNPGAIWWGQIGTSLKFIESVSNRLRDCRSAVLRVPRRFPWRQDFYASIDLHRTAFSGERRLMRLSWREGTAPGEFILDELCSNKVRADYWPGQSYAAYLGSKGDILLCDYYIWVKDIHTRADIERWVEFVTEYERCSAALERAATFIIEYDGEKVPSSELPLIPFCIQNYDCRVFSLETAAELHNTNLPDYQAELALHLANGDPEFCFALLQAGERLLREPVKTAMGVSKNNCAVSDLPAEPLDESLANSAAWKASLVLLFPALERYRIHIVDKYKDELRNHLPISNSYGEQVTDPEDLEINALSYLSAACHIFSPTEVKHLRLCRHVRNSLAHNKYVPFEEAAQVLLGCNEIK